jgi:glycosyltransferase involved in cell wall biosynthesis
MIISLTSISGREEALVKTINSLLNQTVKLDIHLWVSHEPYLLDKGFTFSPDLKDGVFIHYVSNDGPYRKLLPALTMFPNEIIITVDDDTEYHPLFVETIKSHYKYGILAFRASRISETPYNSWEEVTATTTELDLFAKGNGGVVYDAQLFQKEDFYNPIYKSLCPTNDDIWLNFWRIKEKIPLQVVPLVNYYRTNQQESRLWFMNMNDNDAMISATKKFFEVQ